MQRTPMRNKKLQERQSTWGIKPGVPVYLLDSFCTLEVVAEKVLEVVGGERPKFEMLQIGLQEGFKGL